ncbi:MAG: hypothetical protein K2H98_09365 [Duncaniella sp.]|nr:hypothetical protein [Duncaniella sp.]
MLRPPFMKLHLDPQKFNLDSTGFTLIVTADDIAQSLLSLTLPQLRQVLQLVQESAPFTIRERKRINKP